MHLAEVSVVCRTVVYLLAIGGGFCRQHHVTASQSRFRRDRRADGGRRTADGGRRTADGGRRTADGERRTAAVSGRQTDRGSPAEWGWAVRGRPALNGPACAIDNGDGRRPGEEAAVTVTMSPESGGPAGSH